MKMFKDRLAKYTTGYYYTIVFNIKLLKHGIIKIHNLINDVPNIHVCIVYISACVHVCA